MNYTAKHNVSYKVINPKENRYSYWKYDNFVCGCPKNTFAINFRKKKWSFRKPTMT